MTPYFEFLASNFDSCNLKGTYGKKGIRDSSNLLFSQIELIILKMRKNSSISIATRNHILSVTVF